MLKTRIIPTLLYRDATLVKGVSFDSGRRIGSLMQAIKVYEMREVDELVFLDITATAEGRRPDFDLIDDFADECFMPLTVGGGVRTVADVGELLRVGADKIAINSAAVENPALVTEIAGRFGSQCVVVSLDARRRNGGWEVFTHSGRQATGQDVVMTARDMERRGAGEILLTSIDRDGTLSGYDLDLLRAVSESVRIPVIASGGAGCYDDLLQALRKGGASDVAAASMFQFTQQTPFEAKRYLHAQGIHVRLPG